MNPIEATELGSPCSICDNPTTIKSHDGEYYRCSRCLTLRTRYNYEATQYGRKYSENYIEYAETPVNTPLNLFRLGLVSRWMKPQYLLLDVGCCIGEFIRFAEPHYSCTGFEPNGFAAVVAKKRVKSPIHERIQELAIYDAITLFDVLEHIESPYSFLEHGLKPRLEKGGVIVITTPNIGCIPMWEDVGLRKWKHYKPKEHLFLHSEQGLEFMAEKLQLEVLHFGTEESDIRPGNPNGDILTCVLRKTC